MVRAAEVDIQETFPVQAALPVCPRPAPGLGSVSWCSRPPQSPLPERTAGTHLPLCWKHWALHPHPQDWPEVAATVRTRARRGPQCWSPGRSLRWVFRCSLDVQGHCLPF